MPNKKQLAPEAVAAAVYEARTKKAAAEALHVSERCLYDYLKSYEVQSILTAMRADAIRTRCAALDDLTALALDTLREVMSDRESSRAERLRAASIVLDAGRAARSEAAAADDTAAKRLRTASKKEAERALFGSPLTFTI